MSRLGAPARAAGEALAPRGFGGRWKSSSCSTSPSPVLTRGSGLRGTSRTTLSWPRDARVLIDSENRFDGVRVLGVDEHVWLGL